MNQDTAIVKNTANKVTNTAKNIVNSYSKPMNKAINQFKELFYKNKFKVVGIGLIIISIVVYFTVFFKRVDRGLAPMDKTLSFMTPNSIKENDRVMQGNYKLADFYICSSFRSYLPCTNYYDYGDIKAIKYALKYGCRALYLDIMRDSFLICADPVVVYGKEPGMWHYTTKLSLDSVLECIAKTAFSYEISNNTDPVFLFLNIDVADNYVVLDKIYKSLLKNFDGKLLGKQFRYGGRQTNKNLMLEPIANLMNKVIIIANSSFNGYKIDELINLSPDSGVDNVRIHNYDDIIEDSDKNSLIEYNKQNLTIVLPHFKKRIKENYDFTKTYSLGCQMNFMNVNTGDKHIVSYMKQFKNSGLVLKPYKLQHHPLKIAPPVAQNPMVSSAMCDTVNEFGVPMQEPCVKMCSDIRSKYKELKENDSEMNKIYGSNDWMICTKKAKDIDGNPTNKYLVNN